MFCLYWIYWVLFQAFEVFGGVFAIFGQYRKPFLHRHFLAILIEPALTGGIKELLPPANISTVLLCLKPQTCQHLANLLSMSHITCHRNSESYIISPETSLTRIYIVISLESATLTTRTPWRYFCVHCMKHQIMAASPIIHHPPYINHASTYCW